MRQGGGAETWLTSSSENGVKRNCQNNVKLEKKNHK
jgi:hypothetical protein